MKIKMLEHYRDAENYFPPDTEQEVGDVLGTWLVENHKAVLVEKKEEYLTENPISVEVEESQPSRNRKSGRGAK